MGIRDKPHLRQILQSDARYYNDIRTHRSLDKDAPVSRQIQRIGSIKSHAILGGLHHHYAPSLSFRYSQGCSNLCAIGAADQWASITRKSSLFLKKKTHLGGRKLHCRANQPARQKTARRAVAT